MAVQSGEELLLLMTVDELLYVSVESLGASGHRYVRKEATIQCLELCCPTHVPHCWYNIPCTLHLSVVCQQVSDILREHISTNPFLQKASECKNLFITAAS